MNNVTSLTKIKPTKIANDFQKQEIHFSIDKLRNACNEVLKIKLEQLILRNNLLKTTFERNEKLWEKNIGSEIEYLRSKTEYLSSTKNIKELEKQIEKTKFYAQFSGTIDEIFSKIGSNINAGLTPILRLINLDQIYVESEIPEKHILNIKKGSKVIISLSYFNLDPF